MGHGSLPRTPDERGEFELGDGKPELICDVLPLQTSGVNSTNFRTTSLQFDEDGQRITFNIEVYDPLDGIGIAVWDPRGQITQLNVDAKVQKKIIYRVATKMGMPYFSFNDTAVELNMTGNARYKGYAVDLIAEIAKEMGFEYQFIPVADDQYGKLDKDTKLWNGIIGEIVNNVRKIAYFLYIKYM